jgi:hypothetical protein
MKFPQIYIVFTSFDPSGDHSISMEVGAVELSEQIAEQEEHHGRLHINGNTRTERQLMVFEQLNKLKPCDNTWFEYSDSTWTTVGRADGIELSKVKDAVEKYEKEIKRKRKKQKQINDL